MKYNWLFIIIIVMFPFYTKKESNESMSGVKEPRGNILKSLRIEHPRLLAHSEDFEALKIRINGNPLLKNWDNKLIKKGEQLFNKAPVNYDLGERQSILKISRVVVDRIYTLAMLYQLHGNKKYAERAWQELQAAAQFPDWNPKVFLDVAEMTHAFAIGYDWLYQFWTPEQRNFLRDQIITKGLTPARMAYEGDARMKTTWVHVTHNWNLVCNGGIGMGALAIADTDTTLAEGILENVIILLPKAMKNFGPDGAWNEGTSYWDYATRYNVNLLASLKSALNKDFDLEKVEGFSRTGLFPVYMNGPTNKTFNFSDGAEQQIVGSQLFWLATTFNLPSVAQYQKQRIKTPDALDLLWYPSEQLLSKIEKLPLSAYFRNTEVISMRSSWEDPKAWFVGFKAGDNKANHSHLDLGSFVLDAFGKRWAVDLGSESYGLPEYFGKSKKSARWNYYRTRAEGHNTIVLNPSKKYDQDPTASTAIEKFEANENLAFAIADLTPAYLEHATTFRRGIAITDGQTVLVQDEVKTKNPSQLYWFMHTPAEINIQPNKRIAILKIGNEQIAAEIISPSNAVFTIKPATPLMSSLRLKGIQKQDDIKRLTIVLDNVKEVSIIVSFHQAGTKGNPGKSFYQPLNTWRIDKN